MNEWTSGPWTPVQRKYGYPDYEGGPIVRLWDVNGPEGELVASGSIYHPGPENARLIAAAPEMAELLDVIVSAPFTAVGVEHREPAAALLSRIRGEAELPA